MCAATATLARPAAAARDENPPCELDLALAAFQPISLTEMDGVALLDRRDTKYVVRTADALAAMAEVASAYRVLEIDGRRAHHYRTVYFDTPDLALFRAHHRDEPGRYKVRCRQYIDSALTVLEVKQRDKRGRTAKRRLHTGRMVEVIGKHERPFLEKHGALPQAGLMVRLENEFRRVTLVSEVRPERLTIDFGLAFRANGETVLLPGLVVVEVKEPGGTRESDFARALRARRIRPRRFSKYCIGIALTEADVKHNLFNPELRYVLSLTERQCHER